MTPLERFSKWIQLKIYQLEVTYSIYIFTPMEKFVFYTLIFLIFSLSTIAAVLYLPQHLTFLVSRVWFYVHGDNNVTVQTAAKGVADVVEAVTTKAATAAAAAAATTAATLVREL